MSKALIISDLHLEWGNTFVVEKLEGVQFLILAGDIGSFKSHLPFIKDCASKYTVLYVLGNHEFYGHSLAEVRDFWASVELDNFHFLDNSDVIIDGIQFIGSTLWVDFDNANFHSMFNAPTEIKDFQKIVNDTNDDYIKPQDILDEFNTSIHYLKDALYQDNGCKKVLITHYGFSHQSVHPKYKENHKTMHLNHYFTNNLDYLIGNSGASVAVHGHMHDSAEYWLGDTHVVCNPLGYPDALNEKFNYKVVDIT